MNYKRKENEKSTEYLLRLVGIKLEENPNDLDWQDIVNYCGMSCHYDTLRKAMQPEEYGAYAIYKYMLENCFTEDNYIEQLEIKKRELFQEQQINRDILSEYKTYMREESRAIGLERIIEDTFNKRVERRPISIPQKISKNNEKEIVVAFADAHYGADFCITGFMGETINEYNKEIFEKNMFKLREEIVDFSKLTGINKLRIIDLGDSIEGKLHISQLQSLKSNIVDDIIDYSDFIVEWLMSLQDEFIINFYTSEGNHSDLRILSGKKGDFPHENLERIYYRWISRHFKNNPNITIIANKDGLNYFDVLGYRFLTAHGQNDRNLASAIDNYEDMYNIKVNYFLVGHMHSKKEFDISKEKEVIQVRSVMGINEFSEIIKKGSPSGATMFVVEEGVGKKLINEIKF